MLQVLSEIILAILCVYGGYRLLHDLENLLVRTLKKRRERKRPEETPDKDEIDTKGGEDSEPNGSQ